MPSLDIIRKPMETSNKFDKATEQDTSNEMVIANMQSSPVSANGVKEGESSLSQERPDVLWCLSLKEYGKSERNFYKDTTWKGINNGLPGSDPDEDSDSRAVITYTINAEVYDVTGKEPNSSHNWRQQPVEFEFGRDAFLRSRRPPFLTIHSKRLAKLVQLTLGYYPFRIGQGFFAATMFDCFPELMFCFQTLRHYLTTYLQSITEEGRKDPRLHVDSWGDEKLADSVNFGVEELPPQDDADLLHEGSTARDLAVLLRLLSGMYRSSIVPALTSIHLDETPVIAYKNLWMLFRPGTIVYVKQSAIEGPSTSGGLLPPPPPHHRRSRRLPSAQSNTDQEYSACVVAEWIYREGSFLPTPDNEKPYSRIELVLWNIQWMETTFQRIACYADIPKYDSLVPIRDLAVLPAKVHDRFDGGQLRRKLQDRGRKYVGILKEPMAPHREYSYKPAANDGEIIIDPIAYQQFAPPKQKLPGDSARPAAIADGEGFRCWFSNVGDVKPSQVESSPFAEDMYLLLPRWTEGFALRTKKWMVLEIDGISEGPPKYSNNQLESELVLVSDADKRSLKTVLLRGQSSISTVSDFVVGKGEGKVFLLYGGPGTGKTLTVECVANDTRRPLLRITAQDLGLEHNVETELRNWFTLAAKWDAILLIDEADLFLEQRREGDLMRNSLSTVFLRSMEYYKGVLFLTTNRPGHLDDSFISRITCPIAYPALSKETKEKIVRRFVRRFEETGKIVIDPAASEHLIDECADFNGRELRNVLQNAVAAAEMDYREAAGSSGSSQTHVRITVKFLHVRDAVQRHLGFHKYLRTLRGRDEESRAKGKQDYLP